MQRDYGTNDGAVRRAVAAARSAGKSLYFSSGTYRYSGFLILDGVSAFGDGASSVLQADDPSSSAVILRGAGVSLRSLKVTAPGASKRVGAYNSAGVYVDHASGFTVEGVTVSRVENIGIVVLGGADGTIAGNTVSGSYADGIHLTGGSHDITVKGNQVRNVGDDMIAVVSYLDDPTPCANITIVDNDVRGQTWGRGISVVGGRSVTVQRNSIADTSGAGVLVNSDGSYGTYGTTGVRVLQNVISNTDRSGIHHGAIHLEGWPGQVVQGTTVSGNTITDANYRGIVVGPNSDATTITGNTVTRTANEGIFAWGGSNVTITSNQVALTAIYGIYVAKSVTGRLSVLDNQLRDVNTTRAVAIDVVHVEAGSALASGEIRRTTYSGAGGNPIDRLVESVNAQIALSDNRAV